MNPTCSCCGLPKVRIGLYCYRCADRFDAVSVAVRRANVQMEKTFGAYLRACQRIGAALHGILTRLETP